MSIEQLSAVTKDEGITRIVLSLNWTTGFLLPSLQNASDWREERKRNTTSTQASGM